MSESSITLESIVMVSTDQVSCDLGAETIILNARQGMYYGIECVAARVWGLLQKPVSVKELYHTISQEYEVEAERCRNDLLFLLKDFAQKGLIQAHDSAC